MFDLFFYATIKEKETRRRIFLSIWAYAYEFLNHSFVSDARFDEEAKKVDLNVKTNRPDLDEWFKKNFSPHTGSWVQSHPELNRLDNLTRSLINES